MVRTPPLHADKESDHGAGTDKESNDARVTPGIGGATPLQRQEKADDGRDEDGGADDVELENALDDGEAFGMLGVAIDVNGPHDNGHGDATNGEVNVEAPAPGDMVGKSAAEQRTGDGGDAPHAADDAESNRTLRERNWGRKHKRSVFAMFSLELTTTSVMGAPANKALDNRGTYESGRESRRRRKTDRPYPRQQWRGR